MMKRSLLLLLASLVTFPMTASAQSLQPVSLRMDWLPISYHAPFYLAVARGYYKAQGIDLKMQDGKGSGTTVQLISNNVDTFGLAVLVPAVT